jgi:hypothetical protein
MVQFQFVRAVLTGPLRRRPGTDGGVMQKTQLRTSPLGRTGLEITREDITEIETAH